MAALMSMRASRPCCRQRNLSMLAVTFATAQTRLWTPSYSPAYLYRGLTTLKRPLQASGYQEQLTQCRIAYDGSRTRGMSLDCDVPCSHPLHGPCWVEGCAISGTDARTCIYIDSYLGCTPRSSGRLRRQICLRSSDRTCTHGFCAATSYHVQNNSGAPDPSQCWSSGAPGQDVEHTCCEVST